MLTKDVNLAIEILKNNGVIVYPTDTVYGIGCVINSIPGVRRIFEIKKRNFSKPLSVAFFDIESAKKFVFMNAEQEEFITERINEPYTFILPKKDEISDLVTSNKKTVGVRIPNNETVKKILRNVGPIITTSANLSGKKPPSKVDEIDENIKNAVDMVLEGDCKFKFPSRIIDLISFKIVR